MDIFDSLNKKALVSTFQNDFDKIRTANSEIQQEVASKIFEEIQIIGQLDVVNLKEVVPQLRIKYKNLRNVALSNGAKDETDANYAYAALLESVVLAVGNDEIFGKIMNDLMGWFSYLGVMKKV
jgi:hypothetical protein